MRTSHDSSPLNWRCPTEASSLEDSFNKAVKEKEEVKKKISDALLLQEKIDKLKSSENFLSPQDIKNLRGEIEADQVLINKSTALNSVLKKLEDELAQFRSSKELLEPNQELMMEVEIERNKRIIETAITLDEKVSELQRKPEYLPPSEIEKLQVKLSQILNVYQKMFTSQDTSALKIRVEAQKELECILCLKVPKRETPVFSCLQHHLFCFSCLTPLPLFCRLCMQDFRQIPQERHYLAEKMIECLY
jgi:hypothetical protein